ncbi:hypothetical protein MD484_g2510, partial [Candolleomyces efflorescens]
MSSGRATDLESPGANTRDAGTNSGTDIEISGYREAAVLSGLAASVAAQLFGFFNDPNNYAHPMADDDLPRSSCNYKKGNCPRWYYIAFSCYSAVMLNLGAAVAAYILADWKAKYAAKCRFVPGFLVTAGQFVWFWSFYLGLFTIVLPLARYAYFEGAPTFLPLDGGTHHSKSMVLNPAYEVPNGR